MNKKNLSMRTIYNAILKDIKLMDDKELLSLPTFHNLIKSQIMTTVKKPYIDINIISEDDGKTTAFTNGRNITCNTLSPLVLGCENIYEMYLSNIGSGCHECGHVMFTNFKVLNRIRSEIRMFIYKFKYSDKIIGRSKLNQIIFSINLDNLINIIEDGYIENCLCNLYPKTGIIVRGLDAGNKVKYNGSKSVLEVISEIEEGEYDLCSAFTWYTQIYILGYEPKDYDKASGEFFDRLDEALKRSRVYVDNYVETADIKNIEALAGILYELLPEDIEDNDDQDGQDENQDGQNGQSDSHYQGEQGGEGNSQSTESQNNGSTNGQSCGESDKKEQSSQTKEEKEEEAIEKFKKNIEKLLKEGTKLPEDNGSPREKRPNKNNKENKKQEILDQSDSLLKELAKEMATDEMTDRELDDLRKLAEEHGVRVYNADKYSRRKTEYENILANVSHISRQAERKIKQSLEYRDNSDEDSGYYMGSRFNSQDIFSQDGKYFSREITPDEMPDVVFTVCIDNSGSMSGYCNERAIEAAVLFSDLTERLDIPTRIVAHNHTDYWTNIENYKSFTPNDNKYAIPSIDPCGCNYDTEVVTTLCEELQQREEKSKVLIMISDGQPCTDTDVDNYRGVPFKENLRYNAAELNACVRYWRKKGINIFGVCIDEYENIKDIYENCVIDCTEKDNLSKELVKIFSRYVLK